MKNGTTFWLPKDLSELIDRLKIARKDPTRTDTIRFLILKALADLSFLPKEAKKALGIKEDLEMGDSTQPSPHT